MKKSLLVLSLISLYGSASAADFSDTARVISSTPIYERISEPKRECWKEAVQVAPKERSIGGAVIGGVAGGLLGSQVGGGNGRTVATGAGAVAGAVIGDRVANPDQPRTEQVERCREVQNSREVIKGYNVTYRYNGQDFTTTLPYQVQPGDSLRVAVNVSVEERGSRYEDSSRDRRNEDWQKRRYEDRRDRPNY